jgi:hypothetical protein
MRLNASTKAGPMRRSGLGFSLPRPIAAPARSSNTGLVRRSGVQTPWSPLFLAGLLFT